MFFLHVILTHILLNFLSGIIKSVKSIIIYLGISAIPNLNLRISTLSRKYLIAYVGLWQGGLNSICMILFSNIVPEQNAAKMFWFGNTFKNSNYILDFPYPMNLPNYWFTTKYVLFCSKVKSLWKDKYFMLKLIIILQNKVDCLRKMQILSNLP